MIVYCDGGARGNPGPAGIGAAIYLETDGGELMEIAAISQYIGEATNNEAEYEAVIAGLDAAKDLGAVQIEIRADSELVVKQLNGEYRVKSPNLKPLHARARSALADFEDWTARHVRRTLNRRADELVNLAIDTHQASRGMSGQSEPS